MIPAKAGCACNVLLVVGKLFDVHAIAAALKSTVSEYNVCGATGLLEARHWLAMERFDVILADLSQLDCSPAETVKSLSRCAPLVPMIALTSASNDDLGYLAIEQGAEDYISKDNVQPRWLRRSIRYAILRHDSRLQMERMLRRYVDRCERSETAATITMLAAAVENCRDKSQHNEIDALLRYLLPVGDLSAPLGGTSWGIVAKANQMETELPMRRYDRSSSVANDNRPSAASPTLNLSIAGDWQLPNEAAALMTAIDKLTLVMSL